MLRRLNAGGGSSRLLCLPYAGGGGSVYEAWAGELPAGVELWVPDYPAREHRMLEEPIEDLRVLVAALAEAVADSALPTGLFGHSLGALVAFELARLLQERRTPVRCLVVSGMSAPQLSAGRPAPTDAEILADLRRHGVAPPAVFSQPDLLELLMPGLRADYTMATEYRYRDGPRLSARIHALGGTDDVEVPFDGLAAWAEQSRTGCRTRTWEGGHMYLLSCAQELADYVGACHVRSLTAGADVPAAVGAGGLFPGAASRRE
ncbi:medium-chain acyl-[acyl-carrier-protein] hydrolase [Catenulispora sp. GP43]|uniref:thioesterase II family protein n=1 Tax=Catenulispora sp. GP43 TaxID=3156263 RepID=UPI0035145D72